jgi:pyochelin synthetase
VSCYAELVRRLGENTGAHLVGFDGPTFAEDASAPTFAPAEDAPSAHTLTDLAWRCLAALPAQALSAADDAPLVFAGWSFGGALAVEAARLCPAPVARIVVIDTPAPTDASEATAADPTLADFLSDISQTSGIDLDPDRALADPALAVRFAVYRQNLRLLNAWSPQPSTTPVHHLRAADPSATDTSAEHWRHIAPIAHAAVLAGGHFDVFADANLSTVLHAIEGKRL